MKLRCVAVGLTLLIGPLAHAQDSAAPAKKLPRYIPIDSMRDPARLHWIRYDLYASRWTDVNQNGDCGLGLSAVQQAARSDPNDPKVQKDQAAIAAGALSKCARPVSSGAGFPGEADYLEAEKYTRIAFDSAPQSPRAFRRLAQVLAERDRWRELESATRTHLRVAGGDPWGWLILGLALHREGGAFTGVAAVFDSGLTRLPPSEVQRLNRLERVLKPADSTRIAALAPATHAAIQKLYWTSADPLWSREGNESHVEFLVRVVFAELRWSVEEMGVRGADTDRGDVYVRYGPPDAVMASRVSGPPCSATGGDAAWVATSWVYYMSPTVKEVFDGPPQDRPPPFSFTFCGMPMFATSYVPPMLQQRFGEITAGDPVRWDNIRAIAVDSMPAQAARFRATADSIDVMIAMLPPFAGIQRVSVLASPVRSDLWILAGGVTSIAHDTSVITAPGVMSFRHRVPAGNYAYRAEASAEGSQYAARATAAFGAGPDSTNAFPTRGFGMSDVLLGTNASAPRTFRRWTDVAIQPVAGAVAAQSNLALVWESYDLANTNGSAHYDVTISLRPQRSMVGRIAARIVTNVGGAVGIDRKDDRVDMRYERTAPFAPVLVDEISVSLAGTPSGLYRLSVTITDVATKRSVSRDTFLNVK